MATIRFDESKDRWIVDFKRGGVRRRLMFESRREAEEFKRTLLLKNVGLVVEVSSQDPIPLTEVVDRYLTSITTTKSPGTQTFEKMVFRQFRSYFGSVMLDEVGLAELQAYQAHLRRSILGQTANRRFNTLCHFFKTCVDWGLLKDNPSSRLKRLPATRLKAKRALSIEELSTVFNAATPWLRDILWFILVSGVRRSQAVFLRWGAIDFRSRYIHLEASDGFENKDYETNTLPMTEMMELFLGYLHEQALARNGVKANDFVFVDDRNESIRADRLTKEAKKLMKKSLGLESGAVHVFRHTSLTMRHRQGVSLDAVRAIAGHSNIKTTMLYLHSEPEFLRQEMTRTPLFTPTWVPQKSLPGKRGT